MTNASTESRIESLTALARAADERESIALTAARSATGSRRAAFANVAAQAARDASSLRRSAAALARM